MPVSDNCLHMDEFQSQKPSIPSGIFKALNHKFATTFDDVKLSRYLWQHSVDAEKEQRLIRWITLSLSLHNSLNSEVKELMWKTLVDFLLSLERRVNCEKNQNEIEIKSAFTDHFLEELSHQTDDNLVLHLIDVCKCLCFNSKILSEFSIRFQTSSKLAGAWLNFLNRLLWNHAESKILDLVLDFVKQLVQKMLTTLQETAIKNATIFVAKFFMAPAIQVYETMNERKKSCEKANAILQTIEAIFSQVFFSHNKFCSKLYECDTNSSVVKSSDCFEGMTAKQLRSPTFCFFWKLHTFVSAGKDNDRYCITAYRIYLNSSTQTQAVKKVSFFLAVSNILRSDKHQSYLDLLLTLFQMSLLTDFAKLSMKEGIGLQLHQFNIDFIQIMMEKTLNKTISCFTVIAEHDFPSVQSNLGLIVKKILDAMREKPRHDVGKISAFFKAVFRLSFEVRKPGVLLDELILLIIEEIARNRGIQHCVMISGIIGEVVSSFCKVSVMQSLVLDIWKNLQSKARALIPGNEKVADEEQSRELCEEISVRKRKHSESDVKMKRIKLDVSHTDILHCLLVLLNKIFDNVDFCELKSLVLSRKKMSDLLAELRAMIHDLKSCIHVSSDGLLGQYYHLLVVLGHEELTSKFYNPIDSDTEDFIDVENLNTWDVEVGEGASFSSRYYCKQWQAFKIVKLSSKLQQLELEEVFVSNHYEELKAALHTTISSFLALIANTGCICDDLQWKQIPEHIENEINFNSAFFTLLRSNLPVILSMSSDDNLAQVAELILRFYQTEKVVTGGHVNVSAPILDILCDRVLVECSRFRQVFIQFLLKNVVATVKGSKRNKDLKGMFRFALSCSTVSAVVDHTVVIDNVMSVYSKESTAADQNLQTSLITAFRVLSILPYHSYPTNQKLSFLLVVLGCLATCPDNYELHEDCCKVVENLIDGPANEIFLDIFAVTLMFPYFTSRLKRYSVEGQIIIKKLLFTMFKTSSLEVMRNRMVDVTSVDCDSLASVTWLLECYCDVMKRHVGSTGCSRFALVHGEEEVKKIQVTNNIQLIKEISRAQRDALTDSIEAINRLIKKSKRCLKKLKNENDYEEIHYDMMKFMLLATFFVDIYFSSTEHQKTLFENSAVKTCLLCTLSGLKRETNLRVLRIKLQLLLVWFELSLGSKNDENNETFDPFVTLQVSWQEVMEHLLPVAAAVHSSLIKSLLCRLIYCLHWSLPSHECYLEFTTSSIRTLKTSADTETIESVFSYVDLIVSSYQRKTRKFKLVEASRDERLGRLHPTFLNDVFHAIPHLIERVTSSTLNQSNVFILRCAFSSLSEVVNMGDIVSENEYGEALAVLEKVDLHNIYVNHEQSFLPLFSSMGQVLNSILSRAQKMIENLVPHIQAACRKLISAVLFAGRKSSNCPDIALECCRLLERITHFIASNSKQHFVYCILFVVADYVNELGKHPVHPSVKESLDSVMYHFASMCSDEDISVLNVYAAPDIQPVFQNFYSGYSKYFKYKGWV